MTPACVKGTREKLTSTNIHKLVRATVSETCKNPVKHSVTAHPVVASHCQCLSSRSLPVPLAVPISATSTRTLGNTTQLDSDPRTVLCLRTNTYSSIRASLTWLFLLETFLNNQISLFHTPTVQCICSTQNTLIAMKMASRGSHA